MTEVDKETWEEIQRELREGTPDTPERIALMKRADAVYARMSGDELARLRAYNAELVEALENLLAGPNWPGAQMTARAVIAKGQREG